MKYSAVAVAALAALASAQDISVFPACSLSCITSAVSSATNCQPTDYACVCSNIDALTAAATPCVIQACGADVATNQVLPATQQFCANVGSGSGSCNSTTTTAPPTNGTTTGGPTTAATTTTSRTFPNGTVTTGTVTPTTTPPPITGAAAGLESLGAVAMLLVGGAAAILL
jgi:hypothetical protein